MKILRFFIYTAVTLFSFISFNTSGQDPATLLKNMDDLMLSSKDKQGDVKIILINKDGKEKIREATMMQKGTDYRLYRYTQPESQAGIATLSMPDGVMWLYMPAFKKQKKSPCWPKVRLLQVPTFPMRIWNPSPTATGIRQN